MFYKRLTKWSEVGTLHVFNFCDKEVTLSEVTALDIDQIAGRLAELEDKIERGELVDRNDYLDHLMSTKSVLELTNKELDFFVKHDAKIRGYVDEEIIRLRSENQRLKEEAEDQKSKVDHKHTTQTNWFQFAYYYKAELDRIRKRLETVIELPTHE